ncbi:hypothetical protein C8R46DRAFT_1062065, partial [Mycena filopes]
IPMLVFEAGTPLHTIFRKARIRRAPPVTAVLEKTGIFASPTTPSGPRPIHVKCNRHILPLISRAFKNRAQPLLSRFPPILASDDLLRGFADLEAKLRVPIAGETDVADAVGALLDVASRLVHNLLPPTTVIQSPLVVVRSPAEGVASHMRDIVEQARQEGGWDVPEIGDCTGENGLAAMQGAVSIVSEVSLASGRIPSQFQLLSDGRCLYIMVKRTAAAERAASSWFISSPIAFTVPHLFDVLTYMLLWEPPVTLEYKLGTRPN